VMVKSQIHSEGRGREGGIWIAGNQEKVEEMVSGLLNPSLVTAQTGQMDKGIVPSWWGRPV